MHDRNIVILGGGESGVGAAILAKKVGYSVFISDRGSLLEKYRKELTQHGLPYEEGQHTEQRILEASTIIKSPGIPDSAPLVRAAVAKGIEVIGEIEFAARHTTRPVLAITGSNGKTTTTLLTHHLLQTAGISVGLGGNVGPSFARQVATQDVDIWVLEVSSFQLDGITAFRPAVGVLLNITPDHLDRYGYDESAYARSKFRIGMNQTADDLLLLNATLLPRIEQLGVILAARLVPVDPHFPRPGRLSLDTAHFDLTNTALRGAHNQFNAACAVRIARHLGVPDRVVQEGLDSFRNAPHRLEPVGTHAGVTYLNDSKATNVDAVFYALQAVPAPIVWIAGGVDKGNDYAQLLALVQTKVKALVCLGTANEKLNAAFGHLDLPIVETQSAKAAVTTAAGLAAPGDTVLLSPACASFDLFRNYEDRGEQFRAAVQMISAISAD